MVCSRRWLVISLSIACFVGLGGVHAKAQPPGGFGGLGRLADVLRREDVRKELELLDDQVQKLEKLAESRQEQMRQEFSGLGNVSREERLQTMRELFRKAQQETEKEVGAILLPHQLKRAKQLALQYQLRGGAQSLINNRTAEELGISAEQKDKLQKKAAELEEQMRKKIAELRKQNQGELLKLLTPEQQAKWKEMVGEPFEFQRSETPRTRG